MTGIDRAAEGMRSGSFIGVGLAMTSAALFGASTDSKARLLPGHDRVHQGSDSSGQVEPKAPPPNLS